MTDNQKQCFDALTANRCEWLEANRKNKFEGGIKRLLTELNPDNAHFIYELLQNAEDAGARTVRFTLTDTCVEFEHDGTRLFSEQDIESITSIGTSTKKDDPTAIGKFGVGFKAVFAYAGQREDMVLTPVSGDASLDTRLSRLLESAVDAPGPADLDTLSKDRLDRRHHALWQAAAAAHRQREQGSIAYRKESLVGSHRARVAQLQEQLAQADDSKIRRMRQAQLDTAENDFKRRIADLDAAATRADILSTPVVFGHIHIRQV